MSPTPGKSSTRLCRIASEPGAHRFYMWNMGSDVSGQVAHYLEGTQIRQPGTTVTSAGTTQQVPINPNGAALPNGQTAIGLYYDISTSATSFNVVR